MLPAIPGGAKRAKRQQQPEQQRRPPLLALEARVVEDEGGATCVFECECVMLYPDRTAYKKTRRRSCARAREHRSSLADPTPFRLAASQDHLHRSIQENPTTFTHGREANEDEICAIRHRCVRARACVMHACVRVDHAAAGVCMRLCVRVRARAQARSRI